MTDSIKPPGAGPSARIGQAVAEVTADRAASTQATTSTQATQASAATSSAHAALLEQLRSGALNAAQVIDVMVDNALQQAAAQGLPSSERAQLETVLRTALAEDPTLSRWTRALER